MEGKFDYIERFKKLGYGIFVHFGLYSVPGRGEWIRTMDPKLDVAKYEALPTRFKIRKGWARDLAKTAKAAGARYITLTTRHHDGFSLYDTCGLSTFDAPHSASGRDLIREFTDACRAEGLVPFFYHTLLDWHNPDYTENFPKYLDYLIESVEILCKNYGKIGGLWFDGMWDKPNADWQEDRLYATIRKYQPEAMIINNTGLSELGKVGHPELDSVTFERGKPRFVDCSDKPRAGEMCQVLNDHWGYAKQDCNYKSVSELIENLVDCRACNCNFLLNTGLMGNGAVNPMDKALLKEIGKFIRANKNFLFDVRKADIPCEGGVAMTDGNKLYVVVKNVPMSADPNVAMLTEQKEVKFGKSVKVRRAYWLDSGEKIELSDNGFAVRPFCYGVSLSARVACLECAEN